MSAGDRTSCEVLIIGGGIAGASLAYFLAARGVRDVVLLEAEQRTAYHASGRSARTLLEVDPHPVVQALKVRGAEFLRRPPEGFASRPLLQQRGAMRLFGADRRTDFEARAGELLAAGEACELLDARAAAGRVDVLDAETFAGAVYLPDGGFIDVELLLDGYLNAAAAAGVKVRTGARVTEVRLDRGRAAAVGTGDGVVEARWVVNAAGAWAGELARMADASRLALRARLRSITTFALDQDVAALGADSWPLVWSDPHEVYFRPGFDGVMVCAMDETPSPPCDAAGDTRALEEAMTRLAILAPRLRAAAPRDLRDAGARSWGGLRTFADDGVPVVGEDPRRPGFFWLTGQGGCGIETSGFLGRLAAELICEGKSDLFDTGLLAPERFG